MVIRLPTTRNLKFNLSLSISSGDSGPRVDAFTPTDSTLGVTRPSTDGAAHLTHSRPPAFPKSRGTVPNYHGLVIEPQSTACHATHSGSAVDLAIRSSPEVSRPLLLPWIEQSFVPLQPTIVPLLMSALSLVASEACPREVVEYIR